MEYPDLKRLVISQAEAFGANAVLVEDKASGQQILQDLGRETKLPLIGILPEADKITRAFRFGVPGYAIATLLTFVAVPASLAVDAALALYYLAPRRASSQTDIT